MARDVYKLVVRSKLYSTLCKADHWITSPWTASCFSSCCCLLYLLPSGAHRLFRKVYILVPLVSVPRCCYCGCCCCWMNKNNECCDADSDASRASDRVHAYAKPSLLQRSFNPETVTVHSEANMYMCVYVCICVFICWSSFEIKRLCAVLNKNWLYLMPVHAFVAQCAWWSLYTLYLHACQMRFAEGDTGLCCCICVM